MPSWVQHWKGCKEDGLNKRFQIESHSRSLFPSTRGICRTLLSQPHLSSWWKQEWDWNCRNFRASHQFPIFRKDKFHITISVLPSSNRRHATSSVLLCQECFNSKMWRVYCILQPIAMPSFIDLVFRKR